jgi:ADP-dependent NAD(P)H-hydrate dehydratase
MSAPQPLDRALLDTMPLPVVGDGGKDERGRVLVIGGGLELAGAVLLAGTAALRAGAGKLQMATAASVVPALTVAVPEARVFALPETHEGRPSPAAAKALAEHLPGCGAILIGPGMMRDSEGLAAAVLDLTDDQPLVLDAGAMPAVRDAPRRAGRGGRILTPHAGEMARLLDADKSRVEADPLAAARHAAERFGAVVVMKGARSHVVAPEGRAALYAGGGVGLGTSGSGDVLAGLIAGLLARGADAFQAAAWGVWLHGEAGKRLARRIGPLGFLAREIAAEAPGLMAEITVGGSVMNDGAEAT